MAINKVELTNSDGTKNVLVDLTNDTVTAETLAKGKIAHDRSGKQITGTMTSIGGNLIPDVLIAGNTPIFSIWQSKKTTHKSDVYEELYSTVIKKSGQYKIRVIAINLYMGIGGKVPYLAFHKNGQIINSEIEVPKIAQAESHIYTQNVSCEKGDKISIQGLSGSASLETMAFELCIDWNIPIE